MGVNGIYGLSGSGLDIESMVKVGMMGKQNEYDKMAQKYTKNEWTKAAYLEISSSISTFNMTKLSDYKMSASMNAKTAVSSDSSIKVTANASAVNMTHKVAVTSLASNAYLISETAVTANRKNTSVESGSIYLADMILKGNMTTNDGGDTFNVSYGASDIFNATVNKDDVALKFTISTKAYGELTDEEKNKYTVEYTYGDLYGTDGKGVTFNDLVSKINKMGLNVKASYDSVYERFSLYNTESGGGNDVVITLDSASSTSYGSYGERKTETTTDPDTSVETTTYVKNANGTYDVDNIAGDETANNAIATLNACDFISALNLKQSVNGELATNQFTATVGSSSTAKGADGTITVDGVGYTTTDNKVTVNGLTYDTSAATAGTTSVVSISQDVDAIVDKVKSFVEDYNKLLASLYEKYDEKSDSNYKPLTQSQKDGMKEEQITKWEEKAKQGLLYHDSTLGKIILDMRNAISSSIDLGNGETTSVFSIGISTTGLKGQLTLDEDKLRTALSNDSDAVYNVFAKLDVNDMDNSAKMGIAQRLGDVFTKQSTGALARIKSRAGSSSDVTEDSDLNNLLRNLQTKMSNFKKMMNAFEDALYKKYDKMESALARLGTQMNYIMGSSSQ